MLKIVGISIALLICGVVMKNYNRTFSIIITIAGAVLVFLMISDKVSNILHYVSDIMGAYSLGSEYTAMMLRILGIVLIGQFLSNVCNDNNEGALASLVEIATKIIVLTMVLPLFESVIQIVRSLTK